MNQTEMSEQSSPAVENQKNFSGDAEKRNQIGSPYIESVSPHVQKFGQTAPVHCVASCNWPTHTVWRSRSRIMARVRISITAIAYIQHASDMISIPVSMVLAIFGDWVRLTEAPWCRVFHHFTEK